MAFLGGLFGRNDLLVQRADDLLPAARTCAISLQELVEDEFPEFGPIDFKHWHFVVTIAAILVANLGLRDSQLTSFRVRRLTRRVASRLSKLGPKGPPGFRSCRTFFERTCAELHRSGYDHNYVASDTLGTWIVWDMRDRAPANEAERRVARMVGATITHEFLNWWKQDSKP